MYSVEEAADKLRKGKSTVRKWCKILECKRVGKTYVISEDFLEELRNTIRDGVGRHWPDK